MTTTPSQAAGFAEECAHQAAIADAANRADPDLGGFEEATAADIANYLDTLDADNDGDAPALLPPTAFRDTPPDASGAREHPAVRAVFAGRTAGLRDQVSPDDLAHALERSGEAGNTMTDRERLAVRTWLAETSTLTLMQTALDGAYPMRALVRAIHALGPTQHHPYRIRTINTHCVSEWQTTRNRLDLAAESRVRPRGRF